MVACRSFVRSGCRRSLWRAFSTARSRIRSRLGDRVEHDLVELLLADQQRVRADLGPALVVVVAAVEPAALAAALVVAGEGHQGAAARSAPGDAAEQILLLIGPVGHAAAEGVQLAGAVEAPVPVRGAPEVLGHDPELGRLEVDPFALGPVQVALDAPAVALLDSVPDNLTAVERPQQDLADGGRRPAARVPRRSHAVLVQRLGDPREALALGAQHEDPADDGGLLLVYTTNHVQPPAIGVDDVDVVVAVHAAAGDVQGSGLPLEGVVGPLARALALELVGVGRHAQQQLVCGGVDRALAVLKVQKDAHAGLDEQLERVGDLDRLAAEARLLTHHQHLERRPRLERVQQPREPGPAIAELGARDPVVGVHVGGVDGPALADGIGARVGELALDALALVAGAGLVRGFSGVESGDHGSHRIWPDW